MSFDNLLVSTKTKTPTELWTKTWILVKIRKNYLQQPQCLPGMIALAMTLLLSFFASGRGPSLLHPQSALLISHGSSLKPPKDKCAASNVLAKFLLGSKKLGVHLASLRSWTLLVRLVCRKKILTGQGLTQQSWKILSILAWISPKTLEPQCPLIPVPNPCKETPNRRPKFPIAMLLSKICFVGLGSVQCLTLACR